MMIRNEALELLHKHVTNQNLRRHCYAVEAAMRALARHFKADEDIWGLAGLLHDADYEQTKDNAAKHTHILLSWLEDYEIPEEIKNAILAHGWEYVEGNPMPTNDMEWSLYCCDELTGLIVAVALVKPERNLSSVSVDSTMRKWDQKSFAAGANRDQIKTCETKLNIPLPQFIEIVLTSMQSVAPDLGL
jgi:uncharacterized protein